jgi:hypothetical protein
MKLEKIQKDKKKRIAIRRMRIKIEIKNKLDATKIFLLKIEIEKKRKF